MRWLAISCVVAIAACAEDPGMLPNVPPDEGTFTGLTLEFIADTEVPAQLGADVRIEDIYLNGSLIRAIGDATTQDERPTTGHDHTLHWDGTEAPRALAFEAAPVGEYAYVELRIAGRPRGEPGEAFVIRGEAKVDDEWTPFSIRADAPVVVAEIPASMQLEASRPLTIKIELAVGQLLAGIDWDALPEQDGKLRLDEQTPAALASFCDALAGAFRAR